MRASPKPVAIAILVVAACAAPPEPKVAALDFVSKTWVHGVPYEQATALGGAAVPALLAALRDPSYERHWSNIAVTLAMIGDPRAVDPLLRFVNDASVKRISHAHYFAKSNAIMALGYLHRNTGDARILDFLVAASQPQSWARRGVEWQDPGFVSAQDRDALLSRKAILGLALSGRLDARTALAQMFAQRRRVPFYASVEPLLQDAITTNETISRIGLAEYYRRNRR